MSCCSLNSKKSRSKCCLRISPSQYCGKARKTCSRSRSRTKSRSRSGCKSKSKSKSRSRSRSCSKKRRRRSCSKKRRRKRRSKGGCPCPKKKKSKRRRRRKKPKCCRGGRMTINPFLNFLRVFRTQHCGWPQCKIAIEGAKKWCRMSEMARRKFYAEACSQQKKGKRKHRRRKRRKC